MRYIDADALTFSRVRIIHSDGTMGGWNAVVMSSVMNNAPTADVVEVVRCGECRYCKYIRSADIHKCERREHYSEQVNVMDYCSYGERSENGT